MTSCTDKNASKVYPNTMTLDNWEEFVDAPQSLLDQFAEQERQQAAQQARSYATDQPIDATTSTKSVVTGTVTRWDNTTNNWVALPGVRVTRGSSNTITSNTGFYSSTGSSRHICMEYIFPVGYNDNDKSISGVTVGDMIAIQRHILGIQLLETGETSENAARKYVAADVNEDGAITTSDIDMIRNTLGGRSNFNQNFDFVADFRLNMRYINDGGFLSWMHIVCDPSRSTFSNRRAVKRGDVNNTFPY